MYLNKLTSVLKLYHFTVWLLKKSLCLKPALRASTLLILSKFYPSNFEFRNEVPYEDLQSGKRI